MANIDAPGTDWVAETVPALADRVATLESPPTLLVRHAAGVPSGAPTAGEAPIAFDSTASTGGLYVWTGAAWVKGATIP